TRWPRDWSSDVCSSDLVKGRSHIRAVVDGLADVSEGDAGEPRGLQDPLDRGRIGERERIRSRGRGGRRGQGAADGDLPLVALERSEERRVGKECRDGVV